MYPMVECATLADDIKSKGGSWQNSWHYLNQPYLEDGGSMDDYPDFVIEDMNVTVAS